MYRQSISTVAAFLHYFSLPLQTSCKTSSQRIMTREKKQAAHGCNKSALLRKLHYKSKTWCNFVLLARKTFCCAHNNKHRKSKDKQHFQLVVVYVHSCKFHNRIHVKCKRNAEKTVELSNYFRVSK